MKSISAAVGALCSAACLTWAPHAEAGGAKGIRADLPCPYGGAGGVNDNLWSPTTAASPLSAVGSGLTTAYAAELVAGSEAIAIRDQNQLLITSAIQYVYYSSPIPDPSVCTTNTSVNSDGPLEQFLSYVLANNPSISQADDVEVQVNYAHFPASALGTLAATPGSASFTIGGVTYVSNPLSDLVTGPTNEENDFLFNGSGVLLGQITSASGTPTLVSGVPTGWTIKSSGSSSGGSSSGGSSGGTMTAPEIDPSSSIAGITLLAGLLAVSRGGRRTVKISR